MRSFTYYFKLTQDDGGYVATCRDIPEAITQGNTVEDALLEAADALDEALHAYMTDGIDVPVPSARRKGEYRVSAPIMTALKLSILVSMRDQHVSNSELARRMAVDEKEVRRTLDPRHGTRLPRLESALHALGGRAEVRTSVAHQ